nr:hypothetical protein [Tanacetum cinerariifolium]
MISDCLMKEVSVNLKDSSFLEGQESDKSDSEDESRSFWRFDDEVGTESSNDSAICKTNGSESALILVGLTFKDVVDFVKDDGVNGFFIRVIGVKVNADTAAIVVCGEGKGEGEGEGEEGWHRLVQMHYTMFTTMSMKEEEVPLVDGVFEGALGALGDESGCLEDEEDGEVVISIWREFIGRKWFGNGMSLN